MSEEKLNLIIAKNISRYLDSHNKTQNDLAQYMGVTQATVSNWCKGIKVPRMSKIDKICSYFNINRSDLMEERTNNIDDASYYLDPDAETLAQEIYDRPELKVLFDATRNVSKDDIQFVVDMLDRMKK